MGTCIALGNQLYYERHSCRVCVCGGAPVQSFSRAVYVIFLLSSVVYSTIIKGPHVFTLLFDVFQPMHLKTNKHYRGTHWQLLASVPVSQLREFRD